MIEKQEAKRQVLKKRAEQTKVESDTECLNWDEDDEEDMETVPEIPGTNHFLLKSSTNFYNILKFLVVLPREGKTVIKIYFSLCLLMYHCIELCITVTFRFS